MVCVCVCMYSTLSFAGPAIQQQHHTCLQVLFAVAINSAWLYWFVAPNEASRKTNNAFAEMPLSLYSGASVCTSVLPASRLMCSIHPGIYFCAIDLFVCFLCVCSLSPNGRGFLGISSVATKKDVPQHLWFSTVCTNTECVWIRACCVMAILHIIWIILRVRWPRL